MHPELQAQVNAIERYVYVSVIGIIAGIVLMFYGSRPNKPVITSVEKPVIIAVNEGDISERMTKLKKLYDDKLITDARACISFSGIF